MTITPGRPPADCQRLFIDNLGLLDQIVGGLARQHRMSSQEAEGVSGAIRAKLVANDYEMLRRFKQRSSLRTYLVVVAERHVLHARSGPGR